MNAKWSCVATIAMGGIAVWVTKDYVNPPVPHENVDPVVRQYLDTTPKQLPIWEPITAWALSLLCFVGTIYLGMCEDAEKKEKEANTPEAVARDLEVQRVRALHEREMGKINAPATPAEPLQPPVVLLQPAQMPAPFPVAPPEWESPPPRRGRITQALPERPDAT